MPLVPCPKCKNLIAFSIERERVHCYKCDTHWNFGLDENRDWEFFPITIKTEEELEQWRQRASVEQSSTGKDQEPMYVYGADAAGCSQSKTCQKPLTASEKHALRLGDSIRELILFYILEEIKKYGPIYFVKENAPVYVMVAMLKEEYEAYLKRDR